MTNGKQIKALALVLNSVLISNRKHKVKKDPTVVGSFFIGFTGVFCVCRWGGAEIQEFLFGQPKNQRFFTEYSLTI